MRVKAAKDREYGQMAIRAGVFAEVDLPELLRPPLQQLLLDHLLALRMKAVDPENWQWGHFMLLHPRANTACSAAAARYAKCLSDRTTISAATLEAFLDALSDAGESVGVLPERCLGPETGNDQIAPPDPPGASESGGQRARSLPDRLQRPPFRPSARM